MADLEKVIKGLECCLETIDNKPCSEKCPYLDKCLEGIDSIFKPVMSDALALVKAQEPLAVRVIDDFGAIKFGCCPTCKSIINNRGYRFC